MDLLTGAIFHMIRPSLRNSSGEVWGLDLLAGALFRIMKTWPSLQKAAAYIPGVEGRPGDVVAYNRA